MPLDVVRASAPPASPRPGDEWHNTANDKHYRWVLSAAGTGAWLQQRPRQARVTPKPKNIPPPVAPAPRVTDAPTITVTPTHTMSDAPPAGAVPGDFWTNTLSGFLFSFYDDGDTIQWVVANPGKGGNEGPPGSPGPPGADGAPGPAGPPGAASTVPGPPGAIGATGPQGVQGVPGTPGATGSQGPAGATGAQGPQGVKGDTGATGAASTVPGPTGPAGATGAQGPQGIQGVPGATGATGPPGTTDWNGLTNVPATFPPTIPTGVAIATWPYLPLTGGTLTGNLAINVASVPSVDPAPQNLVGLTIHDTATTNTFVVNQIGVGITFSSADPSLFGGVGPRLRFGQGMATTTGAASNFVWAAKQATDGLLVNIAVLDYGGNLTLTGGLSATTGVSATTGTFSGAVSMAALTATNGTFSGQLMGQSVVADRIGEAALTGMYIRADSGFHSVLYFMTAGFARWFMGKDNAAESTGNAGANFVFNAYTDAGSTLGSVFSVVRSTRVLTFGAAPAAPGLTLTGALTGTSVDLSGALTCGTPFRQVSGAFMVDRILNTGSTYVLETGNSGASKITIRYSDFDTHYFRNLVGTTFATLNSSGLTLTGDLTIGNNATFSVPGASGTIGAGTVTGSTVSATGGFLARSTLAVGAAALAQNFVRAATGSTLGLYYGTGVPAFAATSGSMYIRTDGAANTRWYVNTTGSTTWAAVTTP